MTTQSESHVDENAMSASAVISTPREDREGDIIVPMGIMLDNYRLNPTVLWNHGLGSIDTPIAKCLTPDGQLALEVTEDAVTATSYFTEKDELSRQIFWLIAEKLVKATSVRANPIKSSTRRASSGDIGYLLEEWDLVEWSWCDIGCNPEAVAKMLDRKRINGETICAPLLKSLTAVAPKPTEFFKGISVPKENPVAEEITAEETEKKIKADPADETTDSTKADIPDEDQEPAEEVIAMDEMEEDDLSVPMGSKVLRSAYSALKTLKSELEAAAGPLENPDVKQLVEELIAQVDDMQKSVDGCHTKSYSDQDALSKMDEADPEESVDATMKSLHSLLNRGANKYLLTGLRSSIKSFALGKNLTPKQRKELAGYFKSLQRLEIAARNHKPDVTEQQVNELVEQVQILTKQMRDVLPA